MTPERAHGRVVMYTSGNEVHLGIVCHRRGVVLLTIDVKSRNGEDTVKEEVMFKRLLDDKCLIDFLDVLATGNSDMCADSEVV